MDSAPPLASNTTLARESYHQSFRHRMIANILAGGLAGSMTDLIFFPLETIKTRLQASKSLVKISIYKNCFKGISAQLPITFPAAAGYFVGYEGTKYFFDSQMIANDLSLQQKAILGGISAETLRILICNPFEIAKQQMQVGQQSSLLRAFKGILANYGVAGFYRGFFSMLGREIPFSCIQMPIYEVLGCILDVDSLVYR